MARDNPDDYNAMVKDNSGQNTTDNENNESAPINNDSIGHPDAPRREENQFSLKHFLKRDSSLVGTTTTTSSSSVTVNNPTNINHSRSTSNINGNNNLHNSNCVNTVSPSKSATTSSLHNTTGARPKIPQFQSVNMLSSESKMKRSPRFPSFDSQSSLSDLGEEKYMSNIFHSRSNNSFNSEYPLGSGGVGGAGLPSSNSSQYVQRSYSNYDMESPGSNSPQLIGSQNLHNSPSSNYANRSRENLNVVGGGGGHRMGASEFSAALPDFVQDHLVMEQWYNTVSPASVDFEQLPDFAVNNIDPELTSRIHPANDMPFDLTYNSNTARNRATPNRNSSPTMPLDLPPSNLDISFDLPRRRSPDMPPDLTENNSGMRGSGPSFGGIPIYEGQSQISDSIQRLPDFLYDGPIHSGRLADLSQDTPHFSSPDNNDSRLQMENDRLRREQEDSRRIMAEQTRRILELEKALEAAKTSESQYNATIAQSMEENLDKSYLRAATAESLVNKLKQKVKKLTTEVESLRCENESLKEGAVGGAGVRTTRYTRTQELSRELRLAASTAENNLRQLLTGVDNLRLMAASIENIDHQENHHRMPSDDFLSSDSDENDASGKAL